MRSKFNFLLLTLFSNVILAHPLPAFFIKNADEIPNICQSCFPEKIKWGGKPHCAPAAVSNSLIWLSKNGYPELYPEKSSQADLVDKLGEIMGTTQHGGTNPYKVLSGLKNFFEEKKVPVKRFASTGWRSVPAFVSIDSKRTTLDWIKEGTHGKNSVWILIGWAKYDSKKEVYKIYDGHWMTVVGYGKNRNGELNPNIIIVHDPAERAERKNYYAELVEIQKGTIDETIDARSVLKMTGDVIIKPGADVGLIQGAYRLELP